MRRWIGGCFRRCIWRPRVARPLPDWHHVHKELKRRGVTLQLLWEEYRAEHGDGYYYSHFCERYREWLKTVSPTIRQMHAAVVDWAGDTVPVFDAMTGEERRATDRCSKIWLPASGSSGNRFFGTEPGRGLDR